MQKTLEPRIESSLLYTREDGSQDFVHDSLRDFFLAKHISGMMDSGELSVPDTYAMVTGHMLGGLYKIINSRKLAHQVYNLSILANAMVEQTLPLLIGCSKHGDEMLQIVLDNNPAPILLARCYAESSRDKDLEAKVVDYLADSIRSDHEDYANILDVENAFKLMKIKDLRYIRFMFESNDRRLRESAAKVLASYDFKDAEEMLRAYVKHHDWRVRWNAAVCLGEYDTHESRTILYDVLKNDKCAQVSYEAHSALKRSQSENTGYIAEIIYAERILKKDFDPVESQKAIEEIGT